MENIGGNVLIVPGHEPACALVDDHEAGGVGCADASVGVVHSGARVEVKKIVVNQNRAVRAVVRPDAGVGHQIVDPDDVGIQRSRRQRAAGRRRTEGFGFDFSTGDGLGWRARIRRGGHVGAFILERSIVAVGEAEGIKAHDFAAIVDEVNPIALDGGERGHPCSRPVEIGILCALRHDELPD